MPASCPLFGEGPSGAYVRRVDRGKLRALRAQFKSRLSLSALSTPEGSSRASVRNCCHRAKPTDSTHPANRLRGPAGRQGSIVLNIAHTWQSYTDRKFFLTSIARSSWGRRPALDSSEFANTPGKPPQLVSALAVP